METLQSVMHRSRSEMVGSRSYRDLACGSQRRCADELVMRLVEILRACGPQRTVVLSSTWRQPNCAKLVADLEADVSEHLGEPWVPCKGVVQKNCSHFGSSAKLCRLRADFSLPPRPRPRDGGAADLVRCHLRHDPGGGGGPGRSSASVG